MRGKRSKAYRKLMARYAASFDFREPYQVLVDPTIIEDSMKFKMDLAESLKRTLQGEVKPMITQCCIRQLYTTDNQPLISVAKTFERRRCNHPIDEPALSPLDCLRSVVIPNPNGPVPNKHRYIVATDDREIRDEFRKFPGVPGLHIMRSVMVLDQMADATVGYRETEERGKLRMGLKEKEKKTGSVKRKREDGEDEVDEIDAEDTNDAKNTSTVQKKKVKIYGKKQPNPLSVMRSKKKSTTTGSSNSKETTKQDTSTASKKRRKRTHGGNKERGGALATVNSTDVSTPTTGSSGVPSAVTASA